MRTQVSIPLISFLTAAFVNANLSGPVVDLGYAQYQGKYLEDNDLNNYYGIRYAQAPVHHLRWRPPMPIELHNNYSRSTPIDATTPGPACVQGKPTWFVDEEFPLPRPPGIEDCLLLDIKVPANPSSSSLPVMLEIHGGGYVLGSTSAYPGYALMQHARGDMIFVSIQYRLGAYGFLSSADILAHGTANVGLLDQRAALEWVQRNIRAFGGDPNRVTVHGGSAGGGALNHLMIMYGGVQAPPFQAAIVEYPWWQPMKNASVVEKQYRDLLLKTECDDIACLRGLDEDTLAVAIQSLYDLGYNATAVQYYGYGDFYFGPTVDGTIIRDLPSNEFKRGNFAKVPIMTNKETYEGLRFTDTALSTPEDVKQDLEQLFPFAQGKAAFWNRLFQMYPAENFNSSLFQREKIFGNSIVDCPTYYISTAASDWGVPVYKMAFNAGTQLHASTYPYLFNNNTLNYTTPGSVDNTTMSSIMLDWFVSFVMVHDPNAISYSGMPKPHWPTYLEASAPGTSNGYRVIEVNYTNIAVVADQDASPQCDFWHAQSYVIRS
ncbi:alpha/beta-hydrolase [Pseudovirgaria hyperparasitica]|uniref:Carboxylic ester hydrolase n=1 Tax=Pseudovirgaria hyperparasitica TaxID=470096 RepID=A0A6A6VZQ7_9PEZI|nr:alpha/beta-hydrolase [Pseudovirgaria hyperparasitica]KAF2755773.1 alpha/beta-hydrolase [Pseudovirgaria hyperparasitica]